MKVINQIVLHPDPYSPNRYKNVSHLKIHTVQTNGVMKWLDINSALGDSAKLVPRDALEMLRTHGLRRANARKGIGVESRNIKVSLSLGMQRQVLARLDVWLRRRGNDGCPVDDRYGGTFVLTQYLDENELPTERNTVKWSSKFGARQSELTPPAELKGIKAANSLLTRVAEQRASSPADCHSFSTLPRSLDDTACTLERERRARKNEIPGEAGALARAKEWRAWRVTASPKRKCKSRDSDFTPSRVAHEVVA
ncbi:hypothetical protein R3P38DRAFT_2806488 [Favolaschia claudopus]|uniref:Uncharacterized protein n=1 Tax=Favolaschia claudopus TaxID=2862362 RepID=A0AAV9ZJY3_9AGAR